MIPDRGPSDEYVIRNTRPSDFADIIGMSREVYPGRRPWSREQLASHLEIFPRGQRVCVEQRTDRVVGMTASLIVRWDDYEASLSWRDFTDRGMFTNHDPANGRTLYGAEVMVRPSHRRRGIGRRLYAARRALVDELELVRIRAHSRLRGYHRVADRMGPEDYVRRVIRGELTDPTLTFQLNEGFQVIDVVGGYLENDPESLGYAALIEWLNPREAASEDYARRGSRFHEEEE